ncbi:MAG: hypothetical protein IKN91_02825 [Paludibacteraceae bacterium]|nr:hypothetical protein [Paludibacteraceae bacterium]
MKKTLLTIVALLSVCALSFAQEHKADTAFTNLYSCDKQEPVVSLTQEITDTVVYDHYSITITHQYKSIKAVPIEPVLIQAEAGSLIDFSQADADVKQKLAEQSKQEGVEGIDTSALVWSAYNNMFQDVSKDTLVEGRELLVMYSLFSECGNLITAQLRVLVEKPEPVVPAPDTLSVAQAVELAAALDSGEVSGLAYVIEGYVTQMIERYNEQYNNATFMIADSIGAEPQLEVYRAFPLDEKDKLVKRGDFVRIGGALKKHITSSGDTILETHQNAGYEILEAYQYPDTLSVELAVEIAQGLNSKDTAEGTFTIKGYITALRSAQSSASYKSFFVSDTIDGKQDFQFYRAVAAEPADMNIKVGDLVVGSGRILKYNATTLELVNCTDFRIIRPELPDTTPHDTTVVDTIEAITITEFLARADEKTYQLEGLVVDIMNDRFGNFTLEGVDADNASVYVYGLLDKEQNAGHFADLGIEEGDTLVLQGVYATRNGVPTINDAQYISHRKGVPVFIIPDTITVAQAVEIAAQLENGKKTKETYVVRGYITRQQGVYNPNLNENSFWIADDKDTKEDVFMVYAATPQSDRDIHVKQGDFIQAEGQIQKDFYIDHYIYQIAKGGFYEILTATGLEVVEQNTLFAVQNAQLVFKESGALQVYNLTGQVIVNQNVEEGMTIVLQTGQQYIVRLNNRITKIVL